MFFSKEDKMNLIYVPCKNEEEAKLIGRKLVEEKLAHCTNILPKMTSFYFWEGKLQEDSEAVLLVKTNRQYEIVKNKILFLHSYECPAILLLDVKEVNECYSDWSKKS